MKPAKTLQVEESAHKRVRIKASQEDRKIGDLASSMLHHVVDMMDAGKLPLRRLDRADARRKTSPQP